MNVKTTLLLTLLVAAGAGAWFYLDQRRATTATSTTLDFLDNELKPEALSRIELVKNGQRRFLIERTGNDWSLPGKWPVRVPEAQELIQALTHLRSRYTPIPFVQKTDLERHGLGAGALTLKLQVAGKERVLTIGEEPAEENRFNRATYVRLDDEKEVIRLGPGIVAALDRPQDYFQQRRLFLAERVPKDEEGKDKIEQVQATEVRIQSPEGKFTLAKQGKDWTIAEPVEDRAEPDKLRTLLAGLPDFWAERFVDKKDKKLDDFGLDKPDYMFTVTRPGGAAVKVLVGKVSETKERVVTKPGPPNQFGMPQKPIVQMVREEYRYAKLDANDQIFEIKTDKLKDVAVKLDELRDPQVARFKSENVRRVEIRKASGGRKPPDDKDETIVLVKDKEKWKFEQPAPLDAESQPVTELLDKLAGLQARGDEIRDNADPKTVGLEKPFAVVKLSLEEGASPVNPPVATGGTTPPKEKKKRDLTYQLGKSDKEKGKLFVRVEGRPRVSAVDDALVKLVERPVLAYRSRKVLDVAADDVKKIEVARAGAGFTLERKDNDWQLTQPATAKVEAFKADQLARELTDLAAVEFVTPDQAKEGDADKAYGFAKAQLRATVHFKDDKQKPKTLVIGDQRPGKDDYYARVDGGPVFLLKKDVREIIDRDSLAYRPLQVLEIAEDDIQSLKLRKEGKEYTLERKAKDWNVTGPFEATAQANAVEPLIDEVTRLRGEKFVSHAAKEPGKFGLDKPFLEIDVAVKKDKEAKTHRLRVGAAAEGDAKGRYAALDGDGAVFVLGDKAVANLAKDALDLLDKDLVNVSVKSIQKVQAKGAAPFALEHKADAWRVVSSSAPEFTADEQAVEEFLEPWSRLRAERIAAYGPKIDWKEFGLDKPAATLTVSIAPVPLDKDKPAKAAEHSLSLGKEAEGGKRYARLDQQQAVVLLDAATSEDLSRTHLDFLDHRVLKYDLDTVAGIVRQMKGGDFELAKRDEQWRFAKPQDKPADEPTVGDVLEKTFRLRAQRIAAYPAKDLKKFGLEQPTAVVTLKLTDATGAPVQHVIKVGDPAPAPGKKDGGERYAIIDKQETVIVLPAELSKHLTAGPLYFADRNVASVSAPERVTLERGPRKATFTKTDAVWQMTAPVKAEAEDVALEDFLKTLTRLRADEIVAEKADPKQHGFDRPAAQWALLQGDKETLRLLVGNAEAGKEKDANPRRYARLANKDAVFLLNPKQSARALEEYRSRKPWPTFDAVQVEKLTYQGAPAPFTLVKKDDVWSMPGKIDAKVSARTVSDTLDALAGLKVERWLADEKGDLPLHGLQPPQATLEIELPAGKRTLHIGRTEGDSQRRYATIAGESAIFVLSEEDARRIVRPVAAFLDK